MFGRKKQEAPVVEAPAEAPAVATLTLSGLPAGTSVRACGTYAELTGVFSLELEGPSQMAVRALARVLSDELARLADSL